MLGDQIFFLTCYGFFGILLMEFVDGIYPNVLISRGHLMTAFIANLTDKKANYYWWQFESSVCPRPG
jgi:hypothetical protein